MWRHKISSNSRGTSRGTNMSSLKQELLQQLHQIEGLEAHPSRVAVGTALFYQGKEFAHFHHDTEVDLRLTKMVIKSLGLSHPPRSVNHPTRSTSSQWIEVRFETKDDVSKVIGLVHLAVAQL
jgi:hypothetical protein